MNVEEEYCVTQEMPLSHACHHTHHSTAQRSTRATTHCVLPCHAYSQLNHIDSCRVGSPASKSDFTSNGGANPSCCARSHRSERVSPRQGPKVKFMSKAHKSCTASCTVADGGDSVIPTLSPALANGETDRSRVVGAASPSAHIGSEGIVNKDSSRAGAPSKSDLTSDGGASPRRCARSHRSERVSPTHGPNLGSRSNSQSLACFREHGA